ncbi:ester cyclase [Nocardioides sp. IC4_145]|uniref:ester cyclase n=1 Tax=Nocardioides sp. IC4_145 TaxID=2714037 RepID=UPI00140DB08B|nr:ester cyclase [Nocardioides sp. IC4_145]NHC24326.1 ester cyclase [Nocardioides sp. IC4_145]
MAAETMSARIADAWEQAWNHGEVDALDEVLAVDYRRTSLIDPRVLDREDMKRTIRQMRASFPDLITRVDQCIEGPDTLAILWRSSGTHLGEFADVPPTGKRIEVAGASFCRIKNSLITDEVETWDPRDILATLGIHSLRSARENQEFL